MQINVNKEEEKKRNIQKDIQSKCQFNNQITILSCRDGK